MSKFALRCLHLPLFIVFLLAAPPSSSSLISTNTAEPCLPIDCNICNDTSENCAPNSRTLSFGLQYHDTARSNSVDDEHVTIRGEACFRLRRFYCCCRLLLFLLIPVVAGLLKDLPLWIELDSNMTTCSITISRWLRRRWQRLILLTLESTSMFRCCVIVCLFMYGSLWWLRETSQKDVTMSSTYPPHIA